MSKSQCKKSDDQECVLHESQKRGEREGGRAIGHALTSAEGLPIEIKPTDEMFIRRMRSLSNIKIKVDINEVPVEAVIDTAAQVTIISDKLYESLIPKPSVLKRVVLHAAERDLKMTGCKIGPVTISIGSQAYPNVEVYVAPIKDDMLLGLDFLHQQKTIIDLNDGKLDIGQESITMNTCSNGSGNKLFQVDNVTISNNTLIPPCSAVQLPCSLSTILGNYVVEPLDSYMEFISPRSLHSKGSKPIVCLVNVSDKSLKLKQGHVIGIATEIQDIIEKQLCENVSVQKITPSKEVHEIPEHLQELLTKSGEHLSSQEKV